MQPNFLKVFFFLFTWALSCFFVFTWAILSKHKWQFKFFYSSKKNMGEFSVSFDTFDTFQVFFPLLLCVTKLKKFCRMPVTLLTANCINVVSYPSRLTRFFLQDLVRFLTKTRYILPWACKLLAKSYKIKQTKKFRPSEKRKKNWPKLDSAKSK